MQFETTFTGFADRSEAGRLLAEELGHHASKKGAVVVAIPRGGVLTGAALAEELDLPLEVMVVRRLPTPGAEDVAMGAVGPGGVRVVEPNVVAAYGVDPQDVEDATRREAAEIQRLERLYRGGEPPMPLANRTVILVDDGVTSGSTMAAAVAAVRRQHPAWIALAVPVAQEWTFERFRFIVDELVYLETPEPFHSIGSWYGEFAPVREEEVAATLERSRAAVPA